MAISMESTLATLKKIFTSTVAGMKRLAGAAQEKLAIDAQFARMAVKLDRISTGAVKLNSTLLGVFDRTTSTLTFRAGEALEKGELVESEHVQYRIGEVRADPIQFLIEVDHRDHWIPCKVAVLVRI